VELFPGKFSCPDLGLLHRCLTDRVYFLLEAAYPPGKLSQMFGYIFEQYVTNQLGEFTYEGTTLVRTLYRAPRFVGTTDEAGDAILHWGDTAVVMEYKARQLTTREKYGGVEEVTWRGIEDIIGKEKASGKKGVKQLAATLTRFLLGECICSGDRHALDVGECAHIFPVLVTYEEAVGVEAVRQIAEAKFRAELKGHELDTSKVGPLLVLSIDDVEAMESLAPVCIPRDILHEYADYIQQNPKDRAGSFRSFVYNRGYGKDLRVSESLTGRLYSHAVQLVRDELDRRHDRDSESPTKESDLAKRVAP